MFLRDLADDMRAVCPRAWLLNYTNPMAMNVGYLAAIAPELKVLGLCHSVYWTVHDLCGPDRRPARRGEFPQRRGEPPGLDAGLAASGRRTSTRASTPSSRPTPSCAAGYGSTCTGQLGFYPTETCEHSAEYVPWYLHDDAEIERLRIPLRDYVGISAANLAEVDAIEADLDAGRYREPEEEAAEYAPQVMHSLVTGTPRTIQVNTVNTGLIGNLPHGAPVEVPCLLDATGVRTVHVGDLPAACAALNRGTSPRSSSPCGPRSSSTPC